jgi:hypothetical protein
MNVDRSVTAIFSAQPGPPSGSLRVVNGSTSTISQLFVSPASQSTWGPNQLTTSIPPGGSTTVNGIPPGSYDLKAVASGGATTWQTNGVTIVAGGTFTWTVLPPAGSLRVVNSTSYTITQLFVSPASQGTWGADQLPTTIPPGGSFTVVDIPAGTYDLKAVASDGTTFWQTNGITIPASGTYTWTLLPALGALRVVNGSSYTVWYLYLAPSPSGCSLGRWGADRLGSNTLAPGYAYTLTGIPAGTYDLRAQSPSGIVWTECATSIAGGTTFSWTLLN